MFVDSVAVTVHAGRGGDGCVHFHREKFVPRGGPDGGDAGNGGKIIFRAKAAVHTLSDYRTKKVFKAENGEHGKPKNMHGRNGKDTVLQLPVGTQVVDADTGVVLVDLVREGQEEIIARGGDGGKGNAGFVSSIRQAPKFAEQGDVGEEKKLKLELKLVADVALVGLPSAGKSTLISVVSNARPKVAEYPFTTLVPNLGVAQVDGRDIILVDVPGLIEGANEGKGLGHQFLRHIERARQVVQLVDISSPTYLEDFETIRKELHEYSPELAEKDYKVVLSKGDLVMDEGERKKKVDGFEEQYHVRPRVLSAATHEGVAELMYTLEQEMEKTLTEEYAEMAEEVTEQEEEAEGVVQYRPAEKAQERKIEISKMPNWWAVTCPELEKMVRKTNIDNEEARYRIYDVLKKRGVLRRLAQEGAVPGEQIHIGGHLWEYRG